MKPPFGIERPLRLAVDAHDLLADDRGIGRYLQAVLSRFARMPDIELTLLSRALLPERDAQRFARLLEIPEVRVRGRVPRDADVVWHPWNGTFVRTEKPAVVTLHDAAPFAFPAPDRKTRDSQQAPFRRSAASARAIVCDSAFSAAEARAHLAIPAARLHVVPLGVAADFTPGELDALPEKVRGRPYVLHVGAHDERKNLTTLAAAHARAFPDGSCALVLTRASRLAPSAVVCERVNQATLVALYRGATLVAVPSLYEGFGLPLLEAMACGAPALAARAASLPEVGGDAVRYVDDPLDASAWTGALRTLVADAAARSDLAARGLVRAAHFTWDRCATATLAVLAAAASGL